MVKNGGSHPIKNPPKRKFHEIYYASTDPIADFNLNTLGVEDQDTDKAPTECTGYASDHVVGNIVGFAGSHDWRYAMTLFLEGSTPTTAGADPHVALQTAILWGMLRKSLAPFSAATMGELYCANVKNWPMPLQQYALLYAQNGVLDVLGNGDALSSMIRAAYDLRVPISIGTLWYPEWENLGPDAILPMPANLQDPTDPGHNYALDGQKTVNGTICGVINSWQGASYGDQGYCYMPADVAAAVLSVAGTGALTIDEDAQRLLSMAKLLIEHFFPVLSSQFPSISNVYAKA